MCNKIFIGFSSRVQPAIRMVFVLVMLIVVTSSCESVRPYQRAYLNDHEMQSGQPGARGFEESVQSYREGASGGGSQKSSGGCGCN